MKKMTSTDRIKKETMLRVYKKGFGYSKMTVIDNNEHYIAAQCDSEFMKNTSDGDTIQVYLWVEDIASYDFSVILLGRITVDNNIVFLSHTDDIVRKETRRCLTAHVNLPLKFFLVDVNDLSEGISTEDVDHHNGAITELGDREAIIKSQKNLHDDTFLRGHISLHGEDIEIFGKLEKINEGEYSITFSGMNDKDRNLLLDYIFTTYRE